MRTFQSRPAEIAPETETVGLAGAYLTTLVLTLTNPLTIISFAAIIAGLGMVDAGGLSVVAGVFCGSALCWLALLSS